MTDSIQNELAMERTHASWVRTCLTFLVTAIAFRHYTRGDGEWLVAIVLAVGGAVSAVRAALLAPDIVSLAMSNILIAVSLGSLIVHI